MSENQPYHSESSPLPATEYTVISGHEVAGDPGLAQLRCYVPVLAVIAAPFASMNGSDDPLSPLDPIQEWHAMLRAFKEARPRQRTTSAPLALVRLLPPTAERLAGALAGHGADAFRIVHVVAHGERDMLYLEDDDGSEAYAVAEHVVKLFQGSGARIVVLDGCFSRRLAQMLLDDTPVEAVVGTRRRAGEQHAVAFNARFYAELASGAGVREAFRAAVADLRDRPEGQADRYELVVDDNRHEVWLALPEPAQRAPRPLIANGLPRTCDLPVPLGFVGRRELLRKLGEDLFRFDRRLVLLTGPDGIGKRWLAAAFANRFGWRFAEGVVWLRCGAGTTAGEVQALLAQVAGLPPLAPRDEVLAALAGRGLLLVLEGVAELAPGAERRALADLLADLLAPAHHAVIMTAAQPDPALLPSGPTFTAKVRAVERLAVREARTLAMRRAVVRGVEALDVDTIDDFLDRTRQLPWLIVGGVEMIRREGVDAPLKYLGGFDQDDAALPGAYLRRRLEWLLADQRDLLKLLIRAQGMADALDERLALGLAGADAAAQLEVLVAQDLLRRDGTLVVIPGEVRAFIRERFPLDAAKQAHLDRVIVQYFAQTWPADTPEPLDAVSRARLNNVRALVERQISSGRVSAPAELARALVAAAPAFAAAGLAEDFVRYGGALRDQLPEGSDLARLQVAMGSMLSALPGKQDEAGWLFQVTLALEALSRPVLAEASLAYGRHLVAVGQPGAAVDLLARAFRAVMAQPQETDVRVAATLACEWGRALAARGQHADAIKRFKGALAGYARTRQVEPAAAAQRELSASLLALGDATQAEDVLRRALATADAVGRRDLAAELRQQLAGLGQARVEQLLRAERADEAAVELGDAVRHLSMAVADVLALHDRARLGRVLHDLARLQARAGMMDDGAANAARAHRLLAAAKQQPDLAEAAITLGQLRMAQGDAVGAQAALHEALDLARALNLPDALQRAAEILVRVHQIRARHALQGDRAFCQDTAAQAEHSRQRLAELDLREHSAALERIVQGLAAL
jgi:tetratricopeptide (TPR) repeat protein